MHPLHRIAVPFLSVIVGLSAAVSPAQSLLTNFPPGTVPATFPPVPESLLARREPPPAFYITYSTNSSGVGIVHTNLVPEVKREIRPIPRGAIADFGRSTLVWPTDVANEPIRVTAPDGSKLAFQASMLVWADRKSGQNYLLAAVTNSLGQITSGAEVTYSNAFDTIAADIRYEYSWQRNSLEQFIILHENPPLPEGVDTKHLRLEAWTLWVEGKPVRTRNSSVVLRRATRDTPALTEENTETDFGAMKIVAPGKAFSLGRQDRGIGVSKRWVLVAPDQAVGGSQSTNSPARSFLVESVDFTAAKPHLDKLNKGKGHAALDAPKARTRFLAATTGLRRFQQATSPINTKLPPMFVASLKSGGMSSSSPGFEIDFELGASVPIPPGLVSWWEAEGNAQDSNGTNHGSVEEVAYGAGEVSQGFVYTGGNAYTLGAQSSATVTIKDDEVVTTDTPYVTSLGQLYGWINTYDTWVGMQIEIGSEPVTVTQLGRLTV